MPTVESGPLIVIDLQRQKTADELHSRLIFGCSNREAERNLVWQSVCDRQKKLKISSILQSLKDSISDNNYARFNH